MVTSVNKPGTTAEILDGKLLPQISLPTDVVLIIDRAYTGPSGTLYSVSDTDTAKLIFGATSPLITSMRHAYAGGAKNVALYRIGGGGATITNIFGEYTSITTVDESVNAGAGLSVYIGPRPTNPNLGCIIVYKGSKIVYSNIPGSTIDAGLVQVSGFDPANFAYQVGSTASPVPYADVLTNLQAVATQSATASAAQTAYPFGPIPSAGATVSVTSTTGVTTTPLVLTTDYTLTTSGGNVTGITLTAPSAAGDVVEITYLTPVTQLVQDAAGMTYAAGKDSMNANLNTLYELYDTAFENLSDISAFTATIADLADARNIDDGADNSADRLEYLQRVDSLETDGFEYTWSTVEHVFQKTTGGVPGTTTDEAQADTDANGQAIILSTFHPVNFAHRLGMWCWKTSSQATYVNATIGTSGPISSFPIAVNRWIGSSPTKDIYGTIVGDGTGLLGNKFLAGSTANGGGFYATDTGYPNGNPLSDSSGVIIDLGKYLSITPFQVYITSEALTSTPIVRSASAAYAGMVSQTTVGDSTTNRVIPNVTSVFTMKPEKLLALSTIGYVVLQNKAKGLTVFSGNLATRPNSDFNYISTAIAVSTIISDIATVCDPYIGKGIDVVLMTALYNAIDSTLKNAARLGFINGYQFNLLNTGPNTLAVPLVLVAKEELRAVEITVALALSPITLSSTQ